MRSFIDGLSTGFSRFICGLGGHDLLLHAEPGRLSLRCMSCPYETPGWTIKEKHLHERPQQSTALVGHAHAA